MKRARDTAAEEAGTGGGGHKRGKNDAKGTEDARDVLDLTSSQGEGAGGPSGSGGDGGEGAGSDSDSSPSSSSGSDGDSDSDSSDSDSDSSDQGYRAPVDKFLDLPIAPMNQYLTCPICEGYLCDAHTSTECLHTYCKSCILKHFARHTDCPVCHTEFGGKPFSKVLMDANLQGIVDKILPQFHERERAAAAEFAVKAGHSKPSAASTAPTRARAGAGSLPASMQAVVDTAPDATLVLVPHLSAPAPKQLPPLERPHLRTSSKLTIGHLQQYLAMKFPDHKPQDLTLSCNGVPLVGREHSLAFISKTRWRRDSEVVINYALR